MGYGKRQVLSEMLVPFKAAVQLGGVKGVMMCDAFLPMALLRLFTFCYCTPVRAYEDIDGVPCVVSKLCS